MSRLLSAEQVAVKSERNRAARKPRLTLEQAATRTVELIANMPPIPVLESAKSLKSRPGKLKLEKPCKTLKPSKNAEISSSAKFRCHTAQNSSVPMLENREVPQFPRSASPASGICGSKSGIAPVTPARSGKVGPTKATKPTTNYPALLSLQIRLMTLPTPVAEHRFDPKRKWRFDLAWPQWKIAIEVDGAIWSQGRHTRGSGFLKDQEKLNAATLQGWRVLRTTPDGVKTGRALELVEWALKYLRPA